MALYTIADLHLACSVDKPMDIFGGRWQGYMEKIKQRWKGVQPEDTVVICGDISWGIDFKQCRADFEYLKQLNGNKIILKGNHDLWWNTAKKMGEFLQECEIDNISFLHNNCFFYENTAICGTRGWPYEDEFKQAHDEKIFRRELLRLEASLKMGQKADEIICFLHYPPLYHSYRCAEILDLLHRYRVTKCIYGHLHADSLRWAVEGVHEGIEFRLVSGDHVDFTPLLLKK